MFTRTILAGFAAAGMSVLSIAAHAFDTGNPAQLGFNSDKLQAIATMLDEDVKSGRIVGSSIAVLKGDKLVLQHASGLRAPGGAAQQPDDIFRIYSMTKPVTAVAAMQLVEQGKLSLDTPLKDILPAFSKMKVAEIAGVFDVEDDITILDLLRHTSGLVYGFFGDTPARTEYKKHNLIDVTRPTAESVALLASLPLEHEPGMAWEYGYSLEVLGHVVEVISGKRLDVYMKEEIFDPLGMTDTAFFVPASKADRVALPQAKGLLNPMVEPAYHMGGAGLMSTASDYLKFSRMLLNKGEFNGKRILKEETVALMGQDHLGDITPGNYDLLGPANGHGLGFAVRIEADGWDKGVVGDMFWGGYAGTYFWLDPVNDLAVVFMIQNPEQRNHYRPVLREMVYGALAGSVN